MAKKSTRTRRKREEEEEEIEMGLSEETRNGILVVFLFVLAILMFLSFFDIAGSLGVWINLALSAFFGWNRFLVPILIVVIGASLLYPERGRLTIWNYLGLLFFFLSFNGLLNLLLVNRPNPIVQSINQAGGHLGQLLGVYGPALLGFWGSMVFLLALLLTAVLLIFNASLRELLAAHRRMFAWTSFFKRDGEGWEEEDEEDWDEGSEWDDEEEELEEEEEPEESQEEEVPEEEDEEEPEELFRSKPVKARASKKQKTKVEEKEKEQALTSTRRRSIAIPMKLLDRATGKAQAGDIDFNKDVIERTFEEFGVSVEMGKTSIGPTVTQFTLRPAQGVKLSRIVSLQNDLALALAAHPIRIEAPIPGKSLVGIEVPNQRVATVTLRDVMESRQFKKRESTLSIPLGKDVSGSSWIIKLDKMPHMLVAGATGSGKSVCLNTIIISLLYQNGPDDLKFIMVDPKRVELTGYEGIPHLLVPPITKVDDTVNALKWTAREMDRRLDVLAKFGARNIDAYNKKSEERMPKIVVIIDELADLMGTAGREIEGTIVRIAQMARAVGIHLVLATQRPSVDVITGTIKANIPGRIAFAVASQMDSRTILDLSGAEKLLGRGDMLFTSADVAKPKRVQGVFISSDEVERVVKFLKREGVPDYNHAVTEITKAGTVFDDPEDGDPLTEQAIEVILQGGRASTSFLQRRLRVGYARAARIMDILTEMGVISEGNGAKPRDILVEEWPPGGDISEGMPTDQDDLDEAEEDWEDQESEEDQGESEEEWNDSEDFDDESSEGDEVESEDEEEDSDEDFDAAQEGEYLDDEDENDE